MDGVKPYDSDDIDEATFYWYPKVKLYGDGGQIALYRVLKRWGGITSSTCEGDTVSGSYPNGSVTWGYSNYDTETWNTDGCDATGSIDENNAANYDGSYDRGDDWDGYATVNAALDTWQNITGTGIRDAVRFWYDNPSLEYGWVGWDKDSDTTGHKWASAEEATTSERPKLEIKFYGYNLVSPEPTTSLGSEARQFSETRSFTMDMELENEWPYWYQFTGDQFEQDTMNNVEVVGDAVKIVVGPSQGSLTSLYIVYDNLKIEDFNRDSWDGVKWMKSSSNDDIKLQIEWLNAGSWELVPDGVIPNNSTGLSCGTAFCSIDLSSMDENTYDTLRIKALFQRSKSAGDPELLMWALGKHGGITSVSENEEPLVFSLNRIEPNPFTNRTEIRYQIPKRVKVNLQVFDIVGRSVITLVNGVQNEGYYTVNWKGTDRNDIPLPTGVYFLRMEAEDFQDNQKMILFR